MPHQSQKSCSTDIICNTGMAQPLGFSYHSLRLWYTIACCLLPISSAGAHQSHAAVTTVSQKTTSQPITARRTCQPWLMLHMYIPAIRQTVLGSLFLPLHHAISHAQVNSFHVSHRLQAEGLQNTESNHNLRGPSHQKILWHAASPLQQSHPIVHSYYVWQSIKWRFGWSMEGRGIWWITGFQESRVACHGYVKSYYHCFCKFLSVFSKFLGG